MLLNVRGMFILLLMVCILPAAQASNITPIINYLLLDNEMVGSENHAPIARSDSYQTDQNQTISGVNVLDNDSDPDGDSLSVESVKLRTVDAGVLNIASNGDLSYQPSTNFTGTVNAQYRITDGELMSIASITITVNGGSGDNQAPTPEDDSYQLNEDQVLSNVNVLGNDDDPDGDSLMVVSSIVSTGTLVVADDGALMYTPPANFSGNVSGQYIVSDGDQSAAADISIDVASVNDPPVAQDDMATVNQDSSDNLIAVLNNDQDVDDAQLTISDAGAVSGTVLIQGQQLSYTPAVGLVGQDTITYTVEDAAGLTDSAEVSVMIQEGDPSGPTTNRAVLNVIPYMVSSTTANSALDSGDFHNWSVVSEQNGSVSIAGDGQSATFARTSPNDGNDARIYIEFDFGPVWPDADLSVCFNVSGYAAANVGNQDASLLVLGSHITGSTSRTPTDNGIWCTVLEVVSAETKTTVRLGIGVNDNDTRTNSITVSNVSFSPTFDGLPNEYVKIKPKGESRATLPGGSTGINGGAFNYAKEVNYNANTGLTVFNTPMQPNNEPAPSHVMALFDSYGGFISRSTVRWLYYGIDATPTYAMTVNARSGRALGTTYQDSLLDDMFDLVEGPKPGIFIIRQAGNDLKVNGESAAQTDLYLQWHIDWAQAKGMHVILTTATPFAGSTNWTAAKQVQLEAYNNLVRARAGQAGISVIDEYALLDTNNDQRIDGDEDIDDSIDNGEGFAAPDLVHATNPGYRVLAQAHDAVIKAIIAQSNSQTSVVNAHIKASRTECASPCTVVFSAEETTAQSLDENDIWSQLIYYWDFNTGVGTSHGALYNQTYTYVEGDSSFEIGGPMATKTFLCDTGACTYRVGLRAQNAEGDFDDQFITITVQAESQKWPVANTVCVSNTLDTLDDWSGFDKPCPDGATKQTVMLDADDYADKLVLLKKGDSFAQNIATMVGQSNFKIGYFGDENEARPEIIGEIIIGSKRPNGPSNAPTSASLNITNNDLDTYGSFPENVTLDGLRVGEIALGMSYQHIGMHDLDMDWESSNIYGFGSMQLSGFNSQCTDFDTIDCDRVPFPKGAYLSQSKLVGSKADDGSIPILNMAGIGCSMINYTGVIDSSLRRVGEHNIRWMGWWRANIMRSALLGQHTRGGSQKATMRSCVEKDVFNDPRVPDLPGWQARTDLPPNWNQDIEGRTRQDQWFDNGTDDYIHVSRYAVIQNNIIGETIVRNTDRPDSYTPGPKIQFNAGGNNRELQLNILVNRNVFHSNSPRNNIDITLGGFYATCSENTYSDATVNCAPTNPDPSYGMRINPPPLTPPMPPEF